MAIVHLVTPIITEGIRCLDDVKPLEKFGIEIRHSILDSGPASIECEYDEALAVPDTIKKCIEAERGGADAIVIDCMGDPGVRPSREVVSIPVLGPMETSMHLAATLGSRMSVVTVVDGVVPMIENLARIYGVKERLAPIRVIDLPVLEIEKDIERTKALLCEASQKAVEDDRADVIIFGCTGFLGCADAIREHLAERDLAVPVLDPVPVTMMQAAAIANVGLSHSKRCYAPPRPKEIKGYSFDILG
ncbi:aspartate/glutamate racemase family protein [Hyphococcus sp.]|uniref:aspartate/glutamate racemase family protein n=1 Tax=Hyphococcus sp. TaxID=2038636 RepID=UPI0035C6F6F1